MVFIVNPFDEIKIYKDLSDCYYYLRLFTLPLTSLKSLINI